MTRIDLGLLALDAIFVGVGYALLAASGLARLRPSDGRLIGVAYLAGWALMGTTLSLLLMAGVPVSPVTVVVAAAAVAALCAAVRVRRPAAGPAPPPPRRASLPGAVATLGGAVVIAVAAAAALVTAFKSMWTPEFDVLTVWLPRSEIVYYLHHLDVAQWNQFIDPWYPPLVPAMFGTTFEFAGGFHPSLLPVQQATLGLSFVLAVLALLDRFVPRWITFPSLGLLMVTPFFWWRLQSLMPDATLAYLLAAGAVAALVWLYEPNPASLVLGTVFLAGATLAKLEGLVFSVLLVAVVLVGGFILHRRRAAPALVLLAGPGMTIPWHVWLDTHSVRVTNPDFNEPRLLDPSFLAGRTGAFAHAFWLIVNAPWGPAFRLTEAFLLGGAVIVACVVRRIPVIALAAVAWLALMVLALAVTYATSRVAIDPYFSFSAPRVGGAFVVVAATLAPLLLGLAMRTPPARAAAPEPEDHA